MLAHPIQGQFEQEMNALYLRQLGYGDTTHVLTEEVLETFLSKTDAFEEALQTYPRQKDNHIVFECLNELLEAIRLARPPLDRLQTQAMGSWMGDD